MKINILLSAISILLTANCFSQVPDYLWANRAGVNGASANSVVTDANGNVIVAGNFVGANILFGTTTLTNAGGGNSSDIFVVKYDPDGNVLWARKQTGGGTGSDEARGVAADASGNVIVTGTFIGPNIVFGTTTLINAGSGTSIDMFIVKFDPDGNVLWAKKQTAGGTTSDVAKGVVADPNGNVIVTGNFNSPSITFGTSTLTNAGANDIFTVKYDPNGNVLWARKQGPGGSENNDVPYRIAADAAGNVIITGNFQSPTITFGTTTLTNPPGTSATEIFVVKYDPNGNVLWAKQQDANGSANELGAGVAADPSGNIIVSGWFDSPTVTFGTTTLTNSQSPNSIDIFIVKYDCNGNVLWARQQDAGGTSSDNAVNVTADAGGNVIVTGYFEGADITFGTTTLTNAGVRDFFIVKYDPDGNVLWAKQQDAGGAGADVGQSVAADASGNVIVAGNYTAQANPPISITFGTTTLGMPPGNSVGTPANMFVAKLNGTAPVSNQPAPFNCDTTAYLFLDNPTKMYRLNLNSGVSQLVADPIITSPCNQGLNAFGFNPADNYIWGYRQNTNQIVRIASDYSVTIFPIAGLPIKPYTSGDISDSGIMYLYSGGALVDNVFYRIDLGLPSPQLIIPNLPITPTSISDWAISPIDNNLYTIANNTFEVYRFDILGNRTFLGNATGGGVNAGGNFGGIFMDDVGNMYGLNNNNGNIFKIDQPHTGNTTASLFSQGPVPTFPVDGASNFRLQYAPLITLTTDTPICENTSIQLNASASSGNIAWQTDPTLSCTSCNDPMASPVTPTTYIVTATANGCTSRDSVSVSFYTSSLLAVSSDTSICEGASATLNANPDLQINWTPTISLSCDTCNTTIATPTQTTTYFATSDLVGCALSDSVTITVDTVTPIILSNDTTICVNDILQLNAIAAANTVNWFPADYLSCDDCLNPFCTPSTDITYLVTTQNVTCPDSAFITILTLPLPIIDAGNDTTICENGSIQLTANAGSGSIAWQTDPTLSCTSCNAPIATPFTPTIYFVTATDNGCTAMDSVSVSLYTSSLLAVSSDTSICEGASATLTADPDLQVTWTPTSGLSCDTCTTTLAAPIQTTTYVVTTDVGACLLSDSVTITVDTLTPILFSNDTTLCQGDVLVLTIEVEGASITWQDGSTDEFYQVNSGGQYWADATLGQCTVRDTINVFYSSLTLDLGNDTTLCQFEGFELNAGAGALSYTWQDGTTTQFYAVQEPGFFVVNVSDGFCELSDNIFVDLSQPEANFSFEDSTACVIQPTQFNDASKNGGGSIISWAWNFGDGSFSSQQNPLHTFQQPGTYDVRLTVVDEFGCEATYSKTVAIKTFPGPEAFFSADPATPNIYENVQFMDESASAISWEWSFGDGNGSLAQNPLHSYEVPGSYAVELTVSNENCTETIIRNITVGDELIVYVPNTFTPNGDGINDLFKAVVSGGDPAEFEMRIFSRWGEEVFYSEDYNEGWRGSFQTRSRIGTEEYFVPNGVYVWRIRVKENLSTEKFEFSGHVTLIR